MSFYPREINRRFVNPRFAGAIAPARAIGKTASFVCGAALSISLEIAGETIVNARFKAAGCGFLIAAADVLCEKAVDRRIGEKVEIKDLIVAELGEFTGARAHCLEMCETVWLDAQKDFQRKAPRAWNGDEVLICSCFGVSEKTIERVVGENQLTSVAEVTEKCAAGGGCGSCQPLIVEILDEYWLERG